MPHFAVTQATSAVSIQPGAIVSKVIHRDDLLNFRVFGSTHPRPSPASPLSMVALASVLHDRPVGDHEI
jgi:hypothetical protein